VIPDIARLIAVFFTAMLAQWWWSSHGAIGGVAPQLLLVLTVAVAARFGALRAMFLGFFWGLFLDVLSARLVGANALALTLAAYGTGSMRRQVDLLGVGPLCLMVFSATLAYFVTLGLLGLVFLKTFLWVGWPSFLIDPFYNCLVALLLVVFWEPVMGERK
jgi:rod shape-determining protein MreD